MKGAIDLLVNPVEISIMRDGRPLMTQTFQHSPIKIGRILDNDVVLPFDSVSRFHCELRFEDGKWSIYDLKSMNGFKINGQPTTAAEVTPNTLIEIKPVTLAMRIIAAQELNKLNNQETSPGFISSTDETLVGPDPIPQRAPPPPSNTPRVAKQSAAQSGAHAGSQRPTPGRRVPLLNIDALELMSTTDPQLTKAQYRAVQVSIFWHDTLMSVDEFLPGETIVSEINGIFLRLGRAGKSRSEVRCPSGTQFSNRPGKESVLLPDSPVTWTADWGLSIVARYVKPSKIRHKGPAAFFEEELIDPLIISGVLHGAIAIASFAMSPPSAEKPPEPERIAKIIMPTPVAEPTPIAIATPTPTPPPTPTPAVAKATPTPPPTPRPVVAKATPPPKMKKKAPVKKEPPKIAKKETMSVAPKANTESHKKQLAKSNPPPPGAKTDAPLAATPRPFNASNVGALKALNLLSSGPAIKTGSVENIVVRKTAANEDGGGSGSSGPQTSTLMKDLPIVEGGSVNGVAGGMALNVSKGGTGYGTSGFSGKTGKRNILGSVIGGATYNEVSKTEGLTREQVMKVVQKHHSQIQQCYERSLMDDPNIAGRAEFEWEISAKGNVTSVSVKETSLRNGDRLLDCVKGVFKGMKFPVAKNGSTTTPTIGLPFGRL